MKFLAPSPFEYMTDHEGDVKRGDVERVWRARETEQTQRNEERAASWAVRLKLNPKPKPTIYDQLRKCFSYDVGKIAGMLSQQNYILEDMLWKETIQIGIPVGAWRRYSINVNQTEGAGNYPNHEGAS